MVIKANSIKDGVDILDTWGKEVIGLTDASLRYLKEQVPRFILPIVKEFILTGKKDIAA